MLDSYRMLSYDGENGDVLRKVIHTGKEQLGISMLNAILDTKNTLFFNICNLEKTFQLLGIHRQWYNSESYKVLIDFHCVMWKDIPKDGMLVIVAAILLFTEIPHLIYDEDTGKFAYIPRETKIPEPTESKTKSILDYVLAPIRHLFKG